MRMKVQKPHPQPQRKCDDRVKEELAKSSSGIAHLSRRLNPTLKLPHPEKPKNPCIQQQHLS